PVHGPAARTSAVGHPRWRLQPTAQPSVLVAARIPHAALLSARRVHGRTAARRTRRGRVSTPPRAPAARAAARRRRHLAARHLQRLRRRLVAGRQVHLGRDSATEVLAGHPSRVVRTGASLVHRLSLSVLPARLDGGAAPSPALDWTAASRPENALRFGSAPDVVRARDRAPGCVRPRHLHRPPQLLRSRAARVALL